MKRASADRWQLFPLAAVPVAAVPAGRRSRHDRGAAGSRHGSAPPRLMALSDAIEPDGVLPPASSGAPPHASGGTAPHGGNRIASAARLGCRPSDLLDASASLVPFGPPAGMRWRLLREVWGLGSAVRDYPDRDAVALRQAIAAWHGLDPGMVLPGNGAAELFTWAARDAAACGVSLLPQPGFADYARALACWQVRHRRWRSLIGSDLLGAGVLVLLACTAYVPLFFFNVAWFLPMALLPRGVLSELLIRLLPSRRITP